MKIISWNVNGLRAILRRNFLDWVEKSGADIICLQEIKIQQSQIPETDFNNLNYLKFFNYGGRSGYAGVAVLTKEKPLSIRQEIGLKRFDFEGRVLILSYQDFTLINVYMPHGGRGKENLNYKLEVYQHLLGYLKEVKDQPVIVMGDFNIAHTELDLARPKNNKNNTMFTKEEREQLDKLEGLDFIDSFRCFNGDGGNYTWWPYWGNARVRNLGWRIDYAYVSKSLQSSLKSAAILKDVLGSDHCPIELET